MTTTATTATDAGTVRRRPQRVRVLDGATALRVVIVTLALPSAIAFSASAGRSPAATSLVQPHSTRNCQGTSRVRPSSTLALYSTSEDTTDTSTGASAAASGEEESLSDVDARVLRAILEEEKLDLRTEDAVKDLLERGTKPVERPPPSSTTEAEKKKGRIGEYKYASKVLNDITNSEWWGSIRAKTEEVLDSAKILIENRIERDSKLFASLGLFAWERAKRDVARALPETGRTGAAVGRAMRNAARQLAANSSYAEYIPEENFILPPSKYGEGVETNVRDELNTVGDEIKSVTESIRDILSGKGVDGDGVDTSPRRGLRSVAPAGTGSKAAERQRRAYQRRKETVLAREKEGIDKKFRRGVESVTDAAAEIKREMAAEGNRAGYRSEKAVKAIEGKAAAAMLEAGITGEGWGQLPLGIGQRLFGGLTGNRNGPVRAELKEAAVVMPVLTREDLLEEKARFAAALRLCLEAPERTWLIPAFAEDYNFENRTLNEKALEDVITTMICVRDDLEVDEETIDDELEMEDIFEELRQMSANVDTLTSLAAVASDYESAERLKAELLGLSSGDEGSLMIGLDQIESDYEIAKAQQEAAAALEAEERARAAAAAAEAEERARAQAASKAAGASPMDYSDSDTKFIDAVVDAEVVSDPSRPFFADRFVDSFGDPAYSYDGVSQGAETVLVDESDSVRVIGADQVEILMDDEDFDDGYFDVKAATSVSDDEMSRELDDGDREPPIILKLLLRTLDVVFFAAEKTLFAVPVIIDTSKTIFKRLEGENRKGLGKDGWEPLENLQEGRKRY